VLLHAFLPEFPAKRSQHQLLLSAANRICV
jgi:hypothetical protein